jgi:signal transduction histidine kinase
MAGDHVAGRLLVLDRPKATVDDVQVAAIVARLLAAALDNQSLARRLRGEAASAERLRLAADLHDGVLQSLAGVRLQLRNLLQGSPDSTAHLWDRIAELEQLVAVEQRDLGFLVGELRSTLEAPAGEVVEVRLRDLIAHIRSVWDLDTRLDVEPEALTRVNGREVYWIVREGLDRSPRRAAIVTRSGSESAFILRMT